MRVITDDTNPSHGGFIPSRCYKNWVFPGPLVFDTKQTKVDCLIHVCPALLVWSAVSPASYLETVLASRPQCALWAATHRLGEEGSPGIASHRPIQAEGDPSWRVRA